MNSFYLMRGLEAFAKNAGVNLIKCSARQWGGPIGYTVKDAPNCAWCGFKSKEEAYKHWLDTTFGATIGEAIRQLIIRVELG